MLLPEAAECSGWEMVRAGNDDQHGDQGSLR
jgi:hypothetical protein